ncbi:MAG: rod-binding protein [Selenomonadaceae bacterium]|nr:rod-binding protein [Selenomonadaceae bacterium]
MNITGSYLMPQMNSTNTGAKGAKVLNEEASFQEQLKSAQTKLETSSAKKKVTGVMTDAEVAQRNKELRDASVQLEAIMLKMMYNEMYKTVPENKLFGDNNAMSIYRDMYHEELTKKMAEAGGIGLADFIYKQLV